ncbi:hypothetical protein AJ78_06638 [Emergomyces pasteurianus Ep9510]|uniref:Uncharacterized protein n=1 Tax=Emergomyces pasteurianus Ep9510 TaxID=1447872 RepID=A0A1J9QA87_9EURO|nr:hypothetical protein AJ78_06638 [Emergomyces pasteurianus Ep9510]
MSITTIKHCFQKALFRKTVVLAEDSSVIQISNEFQRLCTISAIQNPMDIENFLNSVKEVVNDSLEDLEQHIIEQLELEKEKKEKETLHMKFNIQITNTKILDMIKKLCLYEEQQDKGDTELIQRLNHYERRLEDQRLENRQQQDIQAFFVC